MKAPVAGAAAPDWRVPTPQGWLRRRAGPSREAATSRLSQLCLPRPSPSYPAHRPLLDPTDFGERKAVLGAFLSPLTLSSQLAGGMAAFPLQAQALSVPCPISCPPHPPSHWPAALPLCASCSCPRAQGDQARAGA